PYNSIAGSAIQLWRKTLKKPLASADIRSRRKISTVHQTKKFACAAHASAIGNAQTKRNPVPCDQIRTTTVDLGKVDPTILTDALNAMGLSAKLAPNGYIAFTGGSYHAN